ncbi:MAG: chloride channel protein [Desulfovibrio sp.]|nr:chloride channel protein [Desulfovibrio sp.]
MPSQLPPLLRELADTSRLSFHRFLLEAVLTGIFAGLTIGIFRIVYTLVSNALLPFAAAFELTAPLPLLSLFVAVSLAATLSYTLLRVEPLISGSGIPQVELMLAGRLPLMSWRRLLCTKFLGTLISLSAGLSLGREGPCIQMGAAAGLGVAHFFGREQSGGSARFLVAGAASGMAAAFGAPLAGLFFAFEEMKMVLRFPLFLFCALASFSSYLIVHGVLGLGLVFPFGHMQSLSISECWLYPVLGLLCGLCGALYNGVLVGLTNFEDRFFSNAFLRLLLPFFLSAILLITYPHVLSGFGVTALDLERTLPGTFALSVLLLFKILFSAISFASGASGGILMPMLLVGAIFGATVASILLSCTLIGDGQTGTMLLLGMGGLFAATVRAPLTASALLLEMTGAWQHAPSLLFVAFTAVFVANRLGSKPVYVSLSMRILRLRSQREEKEKNRRPPQ